jgi:sugar phosphate isomerase/epimerase
VGAVKGRRPTPSSSRFRDDLGKRLEQCGAPCVVEHGERRRETIRRRALVCKAVASPACKILFDMYHQQIREGNLIPNIDLAWDEIAYFQIGDNPGRKEPGTGEVNYRNVFRHVHGKGYKGILGMEHGNSLPGARVSRR